MKASSFIIRVTGLVFVFKSESLVLKQVPTCIRKLKTNTFDKSIKFLQWLFLVVLNGFRSFQMLLGHFRSFFRLFQVVLRCFISFLTLVSITNLSGVTKVTVNLSCKVFTLNQRKDQNKVFNMVTVRTEGSTVCLLRHSTSPY